MSASAKSVQMQQPGIAARGLERHMLAWLSEQGWLAVLRAAQPQHRAALTLWQGQDWPAVVRRFDVGAQPGEICLGLPLPPDEHTGGKVRISLSVPALEISRTSAAVELRSALRYTGPWREALTALEKEAKHLHLRIYGSLAMQVLTGLRYLTPASDIDILFHPRSRKQLEDGVALLSRHAAHLPLDGEIVFPGGLAVSWKEWQMAMVNPARVIVKELHAVRLMDTASLLAMLEHA
ncbi:malonate decarboxylase holo-[acyl-carrier-protein] synthase [Janthinobacterium sp. HH01]|uniref:malonate decarboxylase holo-[acyl-carrier-protein] synthase n=1 Tax=Janthinobacterium sp. HH01 TaxID=1198452 RepID=UPI002570A30C|nr:malonate decarboxylase holo-[acyl-carrier-protein] synthase [Janthinobacterium sp. HH01]